MMQFDTILKFLALEGHGVYVWTALFITLTAMIGYICYLLREHKTLQQRLARAALLKQEGKHYDT